MANILPDGRISYDKIKRSVEVQANYIASRQDDHWVDDGIALYTWLVMPWNWGTPKCSHTEVGYWLDGELWFFSSTSRKELGGKNGTRWMPAKELLRNPERWQLQAKKRLRFSGNRSIEKQIWRANSLIGLGYDFYGVGADFVNPVRVFLSKPLCLVIEKLKKIYCSKAVHAVQTGNVTVYSPRRKWTWAKKNGYKLIENTWNYITGE
jgi:hypothetical protein